MTEEKLIKSAKEATKYIKQVLDGKKTAFFKVIYLPDFVSKKIKNILGYSPDYHFISANEIRHARNNHGINGKKLKTGDLPLTDKDFCLIPQIMQNPTEIIVGSDNVTNRKSIRFIKKNEDSEIVYVECEKYNDVNIFHTITAWKNKKR
jgi:hypothetical protein